MRWRAAQRRDNSSSLVPLGLRRYSQGARRARAVMQSIAGRWEFWQPLLLTACGEQQQQLGPESGARHLPCSRTNTYLIASSPGGSYCSAGSWVHARMRSSAGQPPGAAPPQFRQACTAVAAWVQPQAALSDETNAWKSTSGLRRLGLDMSLAALSALAALHLSRGACRQRLDS